MSEIRTALSKNGKARTSALAKIDRVSPVILVSTMEFKVKWKGKVYKINKGTTQVSVDFAIFALSKYGDKAVNLSGQHYRTIDKEQVPIPAIWVKGDRPEAEAELFPKPASKPESKPASKPANSKG